MRRKGLGRGLGQGYKNLVPMDSYVHSLSAKGQSLYAQKTLLGEDLSESEMRQREAELRGDVEEAAPKKDDRQKNVREVGLMAVDMLRKKDIPYVQSVDLDDYGDYSGQIFVELDATYFKGAKWNGYLIGGDNLEDAQKFNIGKITRRISSVLKDLKEQGYTFEIVEKPEGMYSKEPWGSTFEGYDKDYVKIDYYL